MGQSIVQVDAFTATPFAGNPAAVCVLPEPRDDRWMQDVAREMDFAETAFLFRRMMASTCAGLHLLSKLISVGTPPLPALMSCGRRVI